MLLLLLLLVANGKCAQNQPRRNPGYDASVEEDSLRRPNVAQRHQGDVHSLESDHPRIVRVLWNSYQEEERLVPSSLVFRILFFSCDWPNELIFFPFANR